MLFQLHDTPILKSLGNVTGAVEVYHTTWSSELLLDRAPSLTHPRSLASPIPGIMQRKQVNSCSIVPPPSLIPDRWRRRSLALCSANRCELLLDRAPSLTHPRSLASPIPGIMQRKQVCSLRYLNVRQLDHTPIPRSHGVVGGAADSRHTTYSRRFPELKQRLHFIPTPLYLF
ncbi:hypothetical protein BLNAU_11751 [Blattamonas nauphoetae]|uniref:Uncharacterized protein n=1 Tax=Blattamonas nauphoetae TaxID=2049346 RepID=A0ABQ9XLI5_9EUKA|nr:hypothetical protein BLNAU_11751 [Blattamonas nauphoetae]